MDFPSQHTMVLVQEFEDGSQEWHCPTCGRRFIMQWPPNYKRTIIEEGDSEAIHSGGMGGVSMGSSEADGSMDNQLPSVGNLPYDDPSPDAYPVDLPVEDDPYLEPFKAWLDQHNL